MNIKQIFFKALKRYFDSGKLDEQTLRKAVENKVISESQFKEITGQDY